MKKILTLILVVVLTFSVVGCSETQETIEDMVEEIVEMEAFDTTPTIEKTVLYDDNNIKITANELTYGNSSASLNVTFENHTEKELNFLSATNSYCVNSVNGYSTGEGYVNEDIAAGQSLTRDIDFDFYTLNTFGITKIADIVIGFDIPDADNNSIYTGALQLKTSIADSYDYSINTYRKAINSGAYESKFECKLLSFKDDVLYDNNGIRIVSIASLMNKDGEPALFIEIENDSTEKATTTIKEVYVNGRSVYDSTWSRDFVSSKKTLIESINLSNLVKKYEGNFEDVSSISEIKFTFAIKSESSPGFWYEYDHTQEITIELPDIEIPQKED